MLISFDVGGKTAVMKYMADDTSQDAIAAEIAKSGFGSPKWREITQADADAIRAARPKPAPAPQIATGGMDTATATALELVLAKLEAMEAYMTTLDNKIEAVIDATYVTDVEGG